MENDKTQTPYIPGYWLAALIIGWSVDLLFWGHPAGISFPIWVILAIAGLFAAAWWEHRRPAAASYVLAAISLALALTPFLRSEPFSSSITALLAVGSLGLLAATFTSGNWTLYRIGDLLLASMKLISAGLVRGGQSLVRKSAPESEQAGLTALRSVRRNGFPVLRGLILALPVVAVLSALLASADPVFSRMLENILRVFNVENLPQYIFRFTYVLIFTYIFCGVLLFALFPEPVEARPDPNQPWKMRFLGSTETWVILGCVVLLFAIFVGLQFRYLFGGQANISETGFTYSEYARHGFSELVAVAVLSLMLTIGLGAITRRERPVQERTFTWLTIALISLVLIILVSALQRLVLYENAYGFTRLRTYTHIFIPWLAVLLLAAVVLEAVRQPGHFGLALLLVSLGFGLTFTALNVDRLIVDLNLQRARAGEELDANHLVGLSADAVPALAVAYQDPSMQLQTRDKIGAVLACDLLSRAYPSDWRAYRISEARADKTLQSLDLSAYQVKRADGTPFIQLNGEELNCYSSFRD
jgi:hypothetical protein